ncbi:MAG TPA: UDP-3-O-(3-hydroxymyristoyl)glucosamine N-acyltransferase [Rhizomicrobium sp.]
MTDSRFFRRSGPFALGEIASHVGAEVPPAASLNFMVQDIAALDAAETGEISLFSDAKHTEDFAACRASVIVTNVTLGQHPHNGSYLLLVKDPRLAFTQIGHLFYPPDSLETGIHPNAHIDPSAVIGAGSQIGSGVSVGRDAKIGMRCHLGSNVAIGAGVTLEDDCIVGPNSSISHAMIGARVQIASGVSIGGEGFGFVPGPRGLLRVAQLGRVVIGNNVQIGDNCAIDRGTMGDTTIGAGTVIDNLVHIAHNVRIGRSCVLAGQVGIAGSATLGDGVMVGGQVGINDHVTVGSGARIAAKSGVIHDIPEGEVYGGYPAVPIKQWHRQTVTMAKLGKPKPV